LKIKLSNTPVLAFPDFKVPFILTTDATTVGKGAVLSQVQEGIEKPISFTSQQLNKAERAYSASKLETLAVVWATKCYRCYLFGKRFLVRTDHAALKFLRNFADNNSRLMRWSKIKHVDTLSRHVGLIEQIQLMCRNVRSKNRKSHQKNKSYYDKKAKERNFEVNYKVYLFCPARKPGRCHKFRTFWHGPFNVVQKLSDLK
jgi:hypothetical protein